MSSIIPGHEEEFFQKKSKRIKAEYSKLCINTDSPECALTLEEREEAREFNRRTLKELGG